MALAPPSEVEGEAEAAVGPVLHVAASSATVMDEMTRQILMSFMIPSTRGAPSARTAGGERGRVKRRGSPMPWLGGPLAPATSTRVGSASHAGRLPPGGVSAKPSSTDIERCRQPVARRSPSPRAWRACGLADSVVENVSGEAQIADSSGEPWRAALKRDVHSGTYRVATERTGHLEHHRSLG